CDDIGDNVVSLDVATATTVTTTVTDCCCFNRLSHIDSYSHWYQRYELEGEFCYLCFYGLYCPLEDPGDFCCACGPCEVPKSVEADADHSVSNVKESKLLS
ncbi:PREDICTED: uncharacterized protein LOC105453975, partial [Wasmannia auropunctata]|uniref:uncharacterized protein LOC105453975 n=1 Tax=Wasmannia auropunctata TaxID=64793 RepID=UPI0005EDAC75